MAVIFLILGLIVVIISAFYLKDWASGIAGFIYVGLILSIFQLIAKLFTYFQQS